MKRGCAGSISLLAAKEESKRSKTSRLRESSSMLSLAKEEELHITTR